ISFAISANRIKYVATQLIQYGRLVNSNQGFLGIEGQGVTPAVAAARMLSVERGVLVTSFTRAVLGSSPAQRAGVHVGDVITAVNGEPIATNNDLAGATMTLSPGTRVMLTIMRGSQQQTISVTLGERPVSA
ncbi:MAG TPA: PDZ domain-containing protein, partial [Ktedonobacterales bacterium]|nr:PDZ domain-containing protein [Ktedonobacterales bacterium]